VNVIQSRLEPHPALGRLDAEVVGEGFDPVLRFLDGRAVAAALAVLPEVLAVRARHGSHNGVGVSLQQEVGSRSVRLSIGTSRLLRRLQDVRADQIASAQAV
jgi:hypothetical protein